MGFEVRRIRPGEGVALRDVRLGALKDTPVAFESTFEDESARAAATWEDDAAARADGFASANFVAESEAGLVGLVGAYRNAEDPGTVELVSMWVAPPERGQRLGERLVDAVFAWARDAGASCVALWVTRGNVPAIALYTKMGFVPTEITKAHVSHPCHEELRMTRELAHASSG